MRAIRGAAAPGARDRDGARHVPRLIERTAAYAVLLLFPPGATCAVAQDAASLDVSLMSFNIRYGSADDGADSWPARHALVWEVIRRTSPDVLGVQEALRFQLDELHAALPEYAEVGVGRDDGRAAGEYAAILFRRNRFSVADTFWFSDTPSVPGSMDWGNRVPRICTWARLVERQSGTAFYVYNVHLDHQSQPSRERSVELLTERIAARAFADPVIVMGDFNAGEDNPAMRYLRGAPGRETAPGGRAPASLRLVDTFRARHPTAEVVGTFNAFRGDSLGPKIDGIFGSHAWRVLDAAIVRWARAGRFPSDHFPVVATVRLEKPEGR